MDSILLASREHTENVNKELEECPPCCLGKPCTGFLPL